MPKKSNKQPVNQQIFLEEGARFSESLLWQLQRKAYQQFGPKAWSHEGVPFYLTSNPYTARQYAYVVLGYLRDCLSAVSPTPLDLTEPLYILDLGAGSGRFGYLFLRQLLPFLEKGEFSKIKICYVMTDIVESNLTFLEQHTHLQFFLEKGVLDFAFYDHAMEQPCLTLRHSGAELTPSSLRNPLVVIGNYFFDTIPQDFFRVCHGKLYERRLSLSIPKKEAVKIQDVHNPAVIAHLQCDYSDVFVESPTQYYPDFPEVNAILTEYLEKFEEADFLFPLGAFQTIRYLTQLSRGRLCLIAGDQGVVTEEQIRNWGEPKLSKHGTFSLPVSYDAIARYFQRQGGAGFLTRFPDTTFVVFSGILGGQKEQFSEAQLAFEAHLDSFEPTDYWKLASCIEKECSNASLELLLLLLKLGNWDPMNLHAFFAAVRKKPPTASEAEKKQLALTLHQIWDNVYPITSAEGAFVQNMGVLFFEMKLYNEALQYFKRALEMGGESPQLLENITKCHLAIKRQKLRSKR